MIVAIIAACEILFWVFVIAGLAARYLPSAGASELPCSSWPP